MGDSANPPPLEGMIWRRVSVNIEEIVKEVIFICDFWGALRFLGNSIKVRSTGEGAYIL